MKKELESALVTLSEGGALNSFVSSYKASVGETAEIKKTEVLQAVALPALRVVETYLRKRMLRVGDLPEWLEPTLEAIVDKVAVASIPTGAAEINAALQGFTDQRKVLLSHIQAEAIVRIGLRLAEGFDSVRAAEDAAVTATALAKKASSAETAAGQSAEAAKQSSASASTALKETLSFKASSEDFANRASSAAIAAEALRKEAKSHRDASQRSADHALAMEKAVIADRDLLNTILGDEQSAIVAQESLRKTILTDLEETQAKARKILFEATTAALAEQWRSKRVNAQWVAAFWGLMLFVFVGVAISSSIFLIVPQAFSSVLPKTYLDSLATVDASFQHSVLTKLFIVPPLLFSVWFAASQYGHTRDRQLEYGKRETLAKTLEAYQIYLKGLDPDNQDWQKEVQGMFKGAIEKLYEYLLAPPDPDARPSISIFKRKDVSFEEFAEAATKLNAIGIRFGDK